MPSPIPLGAAFIMLVLRPEQAAAQAENPPRFSLTLSPLHLAQPVLELTLERSFTDNFALALIAGAGQQMVKLGDDDTPALALSGGAQARYYLFGDFWHGV